MTLEVGASLGRYTIQGLIGRGGMANVYKAHQPSLDRVVALKVMKPSLTEDPEFVERFGREARAVARLEHPNIVQVYDFDEIGGHSVLAMQFLDGGTLKERLAEAGGPLPPADVARIVRGVADALDHAHSLDIVHRDVKPSNVMLTKSGRVVVTDFGIAKMLGTSLTQYTHTGVGVGTPDYMSPEQGQGMPVDRRSDVYALGAVAYEMLTGHVPFRADTPVAVVLKHVRDPLPRASALNPVIGPAIEAVLDRAMAKTPDQRYATAGALASALEQAVADPTRVTTRTVAAPVPVAMPASPAQSSATVAIPRGVFIGAAAALLVVLAAGGGAIASRVTAPAAPTAFVAPSAPVAPVASAPTAAPAAAPTVSSTAATSATCVPPTGVSGTSFRCVFTGFPPGAALSVTSQFGNSAAFPIPPPPGETLSADANGSWTLRTNSTGAPNGTAKITATGGGVTLVAQYEVR